MMGGVDALELTVDEGRPANAGRFFHLGANLLTLLDELTELPVGWRVEELRTGSAIAVLMPPADLPAEARHLRLVVDSLAAVQAGGPLPDEWTPDAVKAAHRFAEFGQAAEDETDWVPPRLRLVTDQRPGPVVDLTPNLVQGLGLLHLSVQQTLWTAQPIEIRLRLRKRHRASARSSKG